MTEIDPGRRRHQAAPYFAGPDDHPRFRWFGGSVVKILLHSTTTAGQITVVENRTTEPFASPIHVHETEDEAFVLLEGMGGK